jgi:hypothetical protein
MRPEADSRNAGNFWRSMKPSLCTRGNESCSSVGSVSGEGLCYIAVRVSNQEYRQSVRKAAMNDSEERNELVDNAVNNIAKIMQKWDDRLTLGNLRLVERYLKGDIEVLIHFRESKSDVGEYCAVFKHAELAGCHAGDLNHDGSVSCIKDQGSVLDVARDHKQESMLVDVVKLVKYPDRIVPSFVRVDSPYRVYDNRVDALYFSKQRGFEFGGALRDWKIGCLSGCSSIGFDKLPSQMVETASQSVKNFSGNQCEDRRRSVDNFDFVGRFSGIRVLIDDQSIWVGSPEHVDLGFEFMDVVFGPFNLRLDA